MALLAHVPLQPEAGGGSHRDGVVRGSASVRFQRDGWLRSVRSRRRVASAHEVDVPEWIEQGEDQPEQEDQGERSDQHGSFPTRRLHGTSEAPWLWSLQTKRGVNLRRYPLRGCTLHGSRQRVASGPSRSASGARPYRAFPISGATTAHMKANRSAIA